MYFVLSKVLLFLISPFWWILILLAAGLILKNKKLKKRFFVSAALVFLVFSMPVFLFLFANVWRYPPSRLAGKQTYSCVIVLGGFAGPGGPDKGHFGSGADRFIQGLKLRATGVTSHILITSGNSSLMNPVDGFNEGNWAKVQLQQLNLPDSVILIENRSRNTIENAAFTKAMLESNHLKPPYILVTSDFHMRRAIKIFTRAGLNVVPYPCDMIAGGNFSYGQLIPNVNILYKWDLYLKELTGYMVLWFKN